VDRCYHSTAVPLPDGTVLSAGGGEGGSDPNVSHHEAQIFHPPHLFRGSRPEIINAPTAIFYKEIFTVHVSEKIIKVSLIRLSSVTHAFNQNQRINFLKFEYAPGKLSVVAPERVEVCPPGHYMLFAINENGVPSHGYIMCIGQPEHHYETFEHQSELIDDPGVAYHQRLKERDNTIREANHGTAVIVGLTSQCPYGIGACWGGAYEALKTLEGVEAVQPIPNSEYSTAEIYLSHRGLPALENWPTQFSRSAKGSYHFRGVEVTLDGRVKERDDRLWLSGTAFKDVAVRPLREGTKIQWDRQTRKSVEPSLSELLAYEGLYRAVKEPKNEHLLVRVRGPLIKGDAGYVLYLRVFKI
jgi:galactose oxidase